MTQQTANKTKGNGKKYLVYALMVIIFLACMWFIFAPSGGKDADRQGSGFNSDIPDPRNAGIVDDKKTAYEQEQMRLKQEQQRTDLRDYSYMLERQSETPEERAAREERQLRMAPKPVEYYEHPEWWEGGSSQSRAGAIQSSASAHAELTGTLGSFFEEPETDPEKEEMAAEIERLNTQIALKEAEQTSLDNQLALMERSYELAAKYEGGQPSDGARDDAAPDAKGGRKAEVAPIAQVRKSVVSSLAAPMSDAEFVSRFTGERNRGFNTVGAEEDAGDKNAIAAVVHGQQVLVDGQGVRLRTTEPMRAGRILIPRGTILTGLCGIGGERLDIAVSSIEYGGTILAVDLKVYDSDGQPGIYIPGSMELDAFKEIAGNLGQGLGTTINLNQQSAGEQLLTDLGRGAIQGTSQYIAKKAREVKVTLKAGYRIFLLPGETY